MPILKQSSSHTKKRTRIDREMISAPLGDFRHTMHVGRGGDVFGDTSFLSNHGPSSAQPAEVPASKKNGLTKLGTGDNEECKMADSLSQRSQSSGIGSGAGSVSSSPVNNVSTKEDSLWNNSCAVGNFDQVDWLSPGSDCGLKHAESILSFHLDLGPSILDEVLGVMDRDPPTSEWSSPDNQHDFGFKYPSVNTTDKDKHTHTSTALEPQENHYSLPSTLPITNHGLDYKLSTTSENPEGNGSIDEGDSEEEKRSIYEGIADSPEQHEGSLHISQCVDLDDDEDDEDEEEVGQGYTFDDDLDDEIGV
ncbi:cdc42 effector protein 5 [Mixophyes fleayi]|uniref:cdc42 effector protein 5 n=1 Tax=Mixophyes fleayi TaxID=3061075 RepID=UPI003F4E413F